MQPNYWGSQLTVIQLFLKITFTKEIVFSKSQKEINMYGFTDKLCLCETPNSTKSVLERELRELCKKNEPSIHLIEKNTNWVMFWQKRLLAAQKMKFSVKDFFSKYDQIRKKLRIWSHLLKNSLLETFLFLSSGCFASNSNSILQKSKLYGLN